MVKKPPDKLLGSDRTEPDFSGLRVLVVNGHVIVFQFQDAVIADDHAKDRRGKILSCFDPAAHRLTVHDPVLLPCVCRYEVEQGGLLQCMAEFRLEDPGESFNRDKEVLT